MQLKYYRIGKKRVSRSRGGEILSAGDILLKLALEDERFYLSALERRALDVFQDRESSMALRVAATK